VIIIIFPSAWKVFVLRRILGYRIGKGARISFLSVVVADSIELGEDAIIDPLTFIYGLKKLLIGDHGRIAIFSIIYGQGQLEMASRTLVSVNCLIECGKGRRVIMADFSCFGPRNTIYTHGAYLPTLQGFPIKFGDVIMQNYSWTGMNTVILPSTVIGENTIIAPGAVLRGIIASNSFISPKSSQYSVSPIKDKLDVRTKKETRNFIYNAIDSIIRGKSIENEKVFLSNNISEVLTFEGYKIKYWEEGFHKSPQEREIIVGYDLPKELRDNKEISWLDFSDYTHSGNSVVVYRLAHKLSLIPYYSLKFSRKDSKTR